MGFGNKLAKCCHLCLTKELGGSETPLKGLEARTALYEYIAGVVNVNSGRT